MADRLPTGITVLDRQLDGGVPPGSIVLFTANSASQSELLLYELTAERGTLYLTSIRSTQGVRDAIDKVQARTGNPTIRDVGGDAPLDSANRLVRDLPEGANLIIDILDPLEEQNQTRFRGFLNELQTHMVNTGGIAVLHAMKDNAAANRPLSAHVADVVFDLSTERKGSEIINRLAVPKFRGGRALDETIKLKLTDRVSVDTSRDIA